MYGMLCAIKCCYNYEEEIQRFLCCCMHLTVCCIFIPPAPRRERGVYCFTSVHLSVLPSVCPSVRLSFRSSKIYFVAFFSATVDGRNLIFGHKLHIGTPYRGKRFLTRQIPTSCLPKRGGIIGEH